MSGTASFFEDLRLSIIPLFVAIDAIGSLPFISSLTEDTSPTERPRVVRYAMLTASLLGLTFIGTGKGVFHTLGIEIAEFFVASGLILLVLSIRHLMTGKFVELWAILSVLSFRAMFSEEVAGEPGFIVKRRLGLLRVGAVVPALRVADVDFNVGNIVEAMKKARNERVGR